MYGIADRLVLLTRLTAAAKEARGVSYDLNSELYGYAYEFLDVSGEIELNGSISFQREMVAIACTTEIDKIDLWMLAPEAPEGSAIEVGEPRVYTPPFVVMQIRSVHQMAERVSVVLDIEPAIKQGQELRYTVPDILPAGSMMLTYEEIESQDMDYEFVAWSIDRPTRHFSFSVTFPANLAPDDIEHDAWYGFSRMINFEERNRVVSGWSSEQTGSRQRYSLDVQYPVLGLSYIIKWIPPTPAEALERG